MSGLVAVVTGGASGIGAGFAERAVGEGAKVVIADIDGDAAAATAERLGGAGVALGVACDVTVEDDVAAMVAAGVEAFGSVNTALNSAGVGTMAPITEHTVEEWDRVVDICLKGVFLSMKHEARAMKAAGGGVIVNVASINARQPGEGMSAYCSAKAGVEMLTRCGAMELGPIGIRVVGIGPGLVETPLTAYTDEFPAIQAAYEENSPVGRTGKVADIAAALCFLVSPEASWISGDTLFVDGAALTRQYPRFFEMMGITA